MKFRIAMVLGLVLGGVSVLCAHDLFLKLDSYFLAPDTSVRITVLNGTFTRSEGALVADRITDISMVGPDGITQLDVTEWSVEGDSSFLRLETGDPGTYVVGVATRARNMDLEADAFNAYLEGDGIIDVLDARRRGNELGKAVTERYSKHVKAVFQVGASRSSAFDTPLGYPAEIVPLQNPYSLSVGSELSVRCLVDGRPVANQAVIAGGVHQGAAIEERMVRTDQYGVARITLDSPGKWYVKFVNMVEVAHDGLDYESKWATLTFEIRWVSGEGRFVSPIHLSIRNLATLRSRGVEAAEDGVHANLGALS